MNHRGRIQIPRPPLNELDGTHKGREGRGGRRGGGGRADRGDLGNSEDEHKHTQGPLASLSLGTL